MASPASPDRTSLHNFNKKYKKNKNKKKKRDSPLIKTTWAANKIARLNQKFIIFVRKLACNKRIKIQISSFPS